MEENKLVGYIKIEESLPLEAECLGKEFGVLFNNFKATLFTPSLPENFSSNSDYLNHPLIQPQRMPHFSEVVEWGQPRGWPKGEASVLSFRIELYLPDLNSQNNFSKLQEAIEEWIGRLRSNLFAFGFNIDSPSIVLSKKHHEKINFYLFPPFNGENKLSVYPIQPVVQVTRKAAIGLEKFRELLGITSSNKSLKLEYLLLKEAEHSLKVKNYRRSVLDSATAFELSLTNALLNNLKIENTGLLNKILRMNNSLSKKRSLLKFTTLNLPKANYQQKLEDLRNRAIHIGKIPKEEEALEAYQIAKEAVIYLTPDKFE